MSHNTRDTNGVDPILVLGGTGKTGRRIAARLQARGHPVRIGSRSGAPPFDWGDRATWASALRGTRAADLAYCPDLAVPGAADAVGDLGRLAVQSGVQRLVLLSGRGEPQAARAEQAVQATGASWAVMRSGWFSQNFSESFPLEPVLGGEVALPVDDAVPEPFVDAEDIADVAVAALTEHGHTGQVYDLTGPRLLRFGEAVDEIAAATRRPVRFVPVTLEQYATALAHQGVPNDVIGLLQYLFTEVLDGRNAHLADDVQRALGRPPRDFRALARRTAASGVWDPVRANG